MLEIKDILEISKYREYEQGRELYGNRRVHNLNVMPFQDSGRYEVTADIKESDERNGKLYQIRLWIDEKSKEHKIYSYTCTCEKDGLEMCRHNVAAAFSFVKFRKSQELKKEVIPVTEQRPTSKDIQAAIRKYSVTPDTIPGRGQVSLDLSLTNNGINGFIVQAQIGITKKYIVKNLVKLAQDMAAKRQAEYGKNCVLYHDRASFTAESLPKLDFIMELIKGSFPNFEEMVAISGSYRYLPVYPYFMERLFQVYMNQELMIDGKAYLISEQNPKLCLMIRNESDMGISLNMEEVRIINGDRHDFIQYEDGIFRCTGEFSKDVIPFVRAMNSMKEKSRRAIYSDRNFNFINRWDYRAFCGTVITRLRKHIGIVCEGINIEDYMPAEPKFRFYLDGSGGILTLKLNVLYGNDVFELYDIHETDGKYRDNAKEREVLEIVRKFFDVISAEEGIQWQITEEEKLYDFLSEGITEFNTVGTVFAADNLSVFKITETPKLSVGIGLHGDLIDIAVRSGEIDLEEIYNILEAYRMKKKYYRLTSGEFFRLENGNFALLSEIKTGSGFDREAFLSGRIQIPKYFAGYIDGVVRDQSVDDSVRRNKEFKRLVRDMKEIADTDYEVPEELNAKLRSYQKTGYRFLSLLSEFGFGGILADDMGLGKTLQIIALLEAKKESAMIVCPASLVYNWESEVNRFAPDLSVLPVVGEQKKREQMLKGYENYHIIITSYDLLKRDIELYESCSFRYCIADEAQYIKNPATRVAHAVKRIRADIRFALTGTPIENRLSDLYSIFDFVMPGYLKDYVSFKTDYEIPIVQQQDETILLRLQRFVHPFILRRKKEEVLKDLPPKMEHVIYVKMTDKQRELYNARLSLLRKELREKTEKEWQEDRLKILAELTRLRQICCAPDICYENYDGGSGKMDTCMELIEEAVEGEHRTLVFSQFVTVLNKIEQELRKRNIPFLFLSGKNTKEERRRMVEEFQKGQVPVFLISLKAGGTGLNLTAADVVLHVDPWWNGAIENQATDRAYRIGQIRALSVMKLVTKDSIEEKIIRLQERKTELANRVVSGEGMANHVFDRAELMELLDS